MFEMFEVIYEIEGMYEGWIKKIELFNLLFVIDGLLIEMEFYDMGI